MVPSVPWSDQQHVVNYSVNSHLADSSLLPKAVLPMNQSGYTCSICYLCYDQNMSATPPFNLQHPRAVKFNSDALVSCLDVHTYMSVPSSTSMLKLWVVSHSHVKYFSCRIGTRHDRAGAMDGVSWSTVWSRPCALLKELEAWIRNGKRKSTFWLVLGLRCDGNVPTRPFYIHVSIIYAISNQFTTSDSCPVRYICCKYSLSLTWHQGWSLVL